MPPKFYSSSTSWWRSSPNISRYWRRRVSGITSFSFGQCKDIEVAVADIKVLDRNTPVLVGGSTQKEPLYPCIDQTKHKCHRNSTLPPQAGGGLHRIFQGRQKHPSVSRWEHTKGDTQERVSYGRGSKCPDSVALLSVSFCVLPPTNTGVFLSSTFISATATSISLH
jgi:hypothetical protein